MMRFLAGIIRNSVFANVLLVVIIVVGVLSASKMTREFFPEFSTDIIQVQMPFLGADPEEVEESICRKIEEAVDGLQGIKRYTTLSMENMGSAFIEVGEGYDLDEVKDRVSNAIDSISTFPIDAERPIVSEILIEHEVAYLALWGDLSEKQLKEWGERTKDELQALPVLSQVKILGAREYEIGVELSEERLREYGLTFAEVAQAVRRGSLNLAGGTIRTKGEEIRIRTVGRKYTGADFATIVVKARPNGDVITLDRLATIRDGFTEDPVHGTFNDQSCTILGVMKTEEEDAIAIAEALREFVADKEATSPDNLHMTIWSDRSTLIEARINVLLKNGLIGLTIVFFSLWLFLDLRLSFWVGMGIPVSISGALALMWALGATINMISLFGLIMVLGIIVDDAIVIGEAIYVHRKEGDPPLAAAVNGVREVGLPVLAAVTTTVCAFLPLMFVAGIMGKFISILPVVVICALAVSLLEGFCLLPAHLNHLPELNGDVGPGHPVKRRLKRLRWGMSHGMEWFVQHVYGPFVARAIHWRYISVSIAVAVLLVMMGMFKGGFIKFVFFPPVDGNDIVATVEFPRGTPIEVTEDAIQRITAALHDIADDEALKTESGEPMIKHVYAVTGQAGVVNSSGAVRGAATAGSHIGEVRAELLKTEQRGIHFKDINLAWEDRVGLIPGTVRLAFSGIEPGPPGTAIEIWLLGHDMDKLLAAADSLKTRLSVYDGVYQISDDFRRGKNEIRIALKPEATVLGLTVDDLARQVNAGYFGAEALRIQRGRDDVRVRVRYTEEERRSVADLEDVRIRTPFGGEVPFFSVADVSYAPGYSTIVRVDGMREVSVTAEVDGKKANTAEILGELAAGALPQLEADFPGVVSRIEGREKENLEAVASMRIGFPIALFGIFVIIATIFRSYSQPLIIMVTVPFGIIGAVLGHMLLGYDVTMLSMFGIVALSGVVVNDAIVLIERVNGFIADGVPFFEAVKRGGQRRFRAIFLTTVSTCGGLTPLILERDMQAQFLIPMALSIAAGVAFATLLTLLFIPCLFGILNDLRRTAYWLRHDRWPTPEEVEPSRDRNIDLLAPPTQEPLPTPAK